MQKPTMLNRFRFKLVLPFFVFVTFFGVQVQADTISDTETLLNWAESTYPELFPSHRSTQTLNSWIFRHYPETGIYAGVNTNDNGVYVLGGPWGDAPIYVDSLVNVINSIDNQGSTGNSDYLCRNHVATHNNVVGNNTYEFIADDGECFGTVKDFGLIKQQVSLFLKPLNNSEALISLSESAKLTSEQITILSPSGGYNLRVAMELSNTSSIDLCIDLDDASLRNLAGEEIAEIGRLRIFGDMYYGRTSLREEYHSNCVPAGQTRTIWGSLTIGHEANHPEARTLSVEEFATLDHIVVGVKVDIPRETDMLTNSVLINDYFLASLKPSEAIWSTEHEVIQNIDYYEYTIVNSFINMTDRSVNCCGLQTSLSSAQIICKYKGVSAHIK